MDERISGDRRAGGAATLSVCLGIVSLAMPALTNTDHAPGASQAPAPAPRLVDVTAASGLDFRHHHGGTGDKHLPETMGSGVAWLDYDGDGHWDLYLVDSGPLPGAGGSPSSGDRAGAGPANGQAGSRPAGANALYRGAAEGRFGPAPAAGLGDLGYGMGASVADYDGDGWADVYVNNFGPNALYRNNGDGTFADVTAEAGVGDSRWSVSSAWGDLDGDGLPELYVANYVDYDLADPLYCGDLEAGIRSYCHISLFDGVSDVLYHNRDGLGFADITAAAGVDNPEEGKGLGVVMGDVDVDGRLDVYVANDTARNFLYLNRGGLVLEDVGLVAGVGYSEDGKPQAGMGTDLGDVDGDGTLEIVVTNFAFEPVNVYRAVAPGAYLDDTFPLGLGQATLPTLGFGIVLEDLDGDGDLDVVIANGHILDNVSRLKDNTTYEQPNQVFVNRLVDWPAAEGAAGDRSRRPAGGGQAEPSAPSSSGPRTDLFAEATESVGEAVSRARVSRGLAAGDFDGDGRPDLVVSNSNGPAELLRNDTAGDGRRLVLRLVSRAGNRGALGASVWVEPLGGGRRSLREVKSASSYASQNASDLYVGLGDATAARLEVRWPGGAREVVERVEASVLALVVEGHGVVATRPLEAR